LWEFLGENSRTHGAKFTCYSVEKDAYSKPGDISFDDSPSTVFFERLPGFLNNDEAPDEDKVNMYKRIHIFVCCAIQGYSKGNRGKPRRLGYENR